MITLQFTGETVGKSGKNPVRFPDLIPIPETCRFEQQRFRFGVYLPVVLHGPTNHRIPHAINRFGYRLFSRIGRRYNLTITDSLTGSGQGFLFINHRVPGKLAPGEEESYILEVQPKLIRLSAENDIGILRGLQTLFQLIQVKGNRLFLPCLVIRDRPRFTWRGLLIDSCRHFIPLDVIKRNLDGMAAVKLNVFHWHLTDDQGFRIECKSYPRLHELGSDGLYYTQAQVKEIIDYAGDRGIRVIPEFDIPGHSTSWLVGYPGLASAPGPYRIQRGYGIFDPCFNPVKPETYLFFEKFFSEMASLFPDEYIHIGGDEVNGKHWDANPEIQSFMKDNNIQDNHSLQAYFNRKIAKILTDLGKKMVGWEQIMNPGLPEGTIIQSYLGETSLLNATRQGYRVVNSKADELYIDLLYPTEFHYLYDPLPENLSLDENQKKLMLGSEATMWSELVSAETIDSRIWPRTAAIAERLWSPPGFNNPDDMYRRLEKISLLLEELGLRHNKHQATVLNHLTKGADIRPLKILVDTLKPIILYDRPEWQNRYTQLTPLNRLVDAALPDNPVPRDFSRIVEVFLRDLDTGSSAQIKKQLLMWKNNHRGMKFIIDRSPILKEAEELSENLSRIAEIGLNALEFINKKKHIDPQWIEEKKNLLESMKEPRADLIIVIIPAIEKLLKKTIY